jgi:hypothetical protein
MAEQLLGGFLELVATFSRQSLPKLDVSTFISRMRDLLEGKESAMKTGKGRLGWLGGLCKIRPSSKKMIDKHLPYYS